MKYSENAVTAKVHSLFAKRLTDEDYANLLSFHSIDEIFNYLRNETYYSEYLSALPPVTLSRSRLENALQKSLLERKASLCRFQKLIGDETYRYFIKKDETEAILYCARHLDETYIADLFERPAIYAKEQTVSVKKLQKAMSFDEFLSLLSGTPYAKLIEPLAAYADNSQNLAVLERILFNKLYSDVKSLICKKYKGKAREEILSYIEFVSDMNAVSSLYRLTENYPDAKKIITGIFIPSVTAFTPKEQREFTAAEHSDEILNTVKKSVYGKYFSEEFTDIDLFVRKLIINKSIKNIRYTQNPTLALFSYETVIKNEVKNITHIIEGVNYGLTPDEISDIIVKGGC